MSLTKLEKLGEIAGFIPTVSTFTGLIKAFIYYKRAERQQSDKSALSGTAEKVNIAAIKVNVKVEKQECYDRLWKASIAEAIPGINIIAAIYSAIVLSRLSDIRAINKDAASQKDYLCKKYEVELDSAHWMSDALKIVHNLKLTGIKGDVEDTGTYTTKQLTGISADEIKQIFANKLVRFSYEKTNRLSSASQVLNKMVSSLIVENSRSIDINHKRLRENESVLIKQTEIKQKINILESYDNVLKEVLNSLVNR